MTKERITRHGKNLKYSVFFRVLCGAKVNTKKSGCAFLHIHFKWQSLLDAQFLLHILWNTVLVNKNIYGLGADIAFRHVQVTSESIAFSTP